MLDNLKVLQFLFGDITLNFKIYLNVLSIILFKLDLIYNTYLLKKTQGNKSISRL